MSKASNASKSLKLRRNQPLYGVWSAMKRRCNNPNVPEYKWYGARGITISESWLKFENFEKDMLNGYEKGLTLDRIDNSMGYSKENCRWATRVEQANNTRNIDKAIRYTFEGISLTVKQWAEKTGIKRSTMHMRLVNYKWPIERALREGVQIA